MSLPILATKTYIPPPRPQIVRRPHLTERLNEGLNSGCKLTLVSAPAGFGKTTLVSEWTATIERPTAWLSLDEGDNNPIRFLAYLVAALKTITPNIGEGILGVLQSPQPPKIEGILTNLINEIASIPEGFVLVLDDYHVIDSKPVDTSMSVDEAVTFILEHQPPQMHLAIATRENPQLPLARYRAQGHLTELRAADLRFTIAEATEFLNHIMGLNLSKENIAALENRTEGWIVGLQLAAISLQGHEDITDFIASFTGSHHFILDYLLEEVLNQQPENVQEFLLRTSILDRMCGPLCDAVRFDDTKSPAGQENGQAILKYLERANLFIVPLDNERRWYRYHHLFGDLLRQRSGQHLTPEATAENHVRASQWYEDTGLVFEAFRHATSANDVDRAERLIESKAMPLHLHSVAMAIVDWLISLPISVLDARPWLWVKSCTLALMAGQTTGVEERLQAAEKALQSIESVPSNVEGFNEKIRDQIGQIACARATLALTHYQPEEMIIQSRRALEYLHSDNLVFRFTADWALSTAYLFLGDRAAAAQAGQEALTISQQSGDIFSTVLALSGLGLIQELENQLHLAAETYQRLLPILGEHPHPSATEVYLGLARIYYQWNDLEAAEQYGQQSLLFAHQYDRMIDRFIISEVFLARLKLAQGDVVGAAALLAKTDETVHQKNFVHRVSEVAAAQVLVLLRQGDLEKAARLAQKHELLTKQARVHLAKGNPSRALEILGPLRQQMEAKGWQDERLKVLVLQAVALHVRSEREEALQVLAEALVLAEPGGLIRIFVDEGLPMAQLLSQATARGIMPDYTGRLLEAFEVEKQRETDESHLYSSASSQRLIEPLSQREIEILQLIAQGLSNREISEKLFLALSTVKGHNRRIYAKLQVQRRTEAIARARELGLL